MALTVDEFLTRRQQLRQHQYELRLFEMKVRYRIGASTSWWVFQAAWKQQAI